ncbi:MAG: DUF4381 domain-containing protein [Methylococcales bacterium]|nr:MAG: DUF4381 domain-containing protein [Methylococcales bacterium]
MQETELPLKDIHLPDAISWWPPAIGWWLLVLLIPTLLVFSYWLYKRLTRKTALKTAKKELAAIKINAELDNTQKLRELSMLLRRVAVSLAPRAEVASLTGQSWLAYLDQSLTGAPFSVGAGQLLISAPYRNVAPSDEEINLFISLCEDWLKAQTKPAKNKKTS